MDMHYAQRSLTVFQGFAEHVGLGEAIFEFRDGESPVATIGVVVNVRGERRTWTQPLSPTMLHAHESLLRHMGEVLAEDAREAIRRG
jgi:hypothetical protein